MTKKIQILIIADSAQETLDLLQANDIPVKQVTDIQAVEALEAKRKDKTPIGKSSCCGQGKKKSPSMMKKAKNYANTMARWVKAGMPIVNMEVFAKRLTVCGACESLKSYECTECGCPMDTKAKMNIDNLCELNKW